MSEFDLAGFSKAVADRAEAAAALTASISVDRHFASAFHLRDGPYVAPEEAVDADAEIEATLASGEHVKAELLGSDAATGIAVLKPAGASPLSPFAHARGVRAGALAIVAGRNG